MPDHIEVTKKAIEFRGPDYLPMEIIDVPHVYNAYHTLDPETVPFIPGTEDFDVLWPCAYSWQHTETGKTAGGEILKRDQFGVKLKTPLDEKSVYVLLEHPLAGRDSSRGYEFPDPDELDPQLQSLGVTLRERYPDRFISAKIDPGIFLTSQFLFGMQNFLMLIGENPSAAASPWDRPTRPASARDASIPTTASKCITPTVR
jgi:hypothetical protein